jgi:hypothetical protein
MDATVTITFQNHKKYCKIRLTRITFFKQDVNDERRSGQLRSSIFDLSHEGI